MFSVASFFAGVGGIDLGFEETGDLRPYMQMSLIHMPVKHLK